MESKTRLHHVAQNITRGSLEDVLEMYQLLGCQISYRPDNDNTWAMVAQDGLNFDIQVVEVDEKPVQDLEKKRNTHIALISDDPNEVIGKIKTWAEKKGITFREGGWSEIERYFDLPGVFVNFVIEIMHTSITGN